MDGAIFDAAKINFDAFLTQVVTNHIVFLDVYDMPKSN